MGVYDIQELKRRRAELRAGVLSLVADLEHGAKSLARSTKPAPIDSTLPIGPPERLIVEAKHTLDKHSAVTSSTLRIKERIDLTDREIASAVAATARRITLIDERERLVSNLGKARAAEEAHRKMVFRLIMGAAALAVVLFLVLLAR